MQLTMATVDEYLTSVTYLCSKLSQIGGLRPVSLLINIGSNQKFGLANTSPVFGAKTFGAKGFGAQSFGGKTTEPLLQRSNFLFL
jgi:hypothetical protein